ncbi:MAG: protein kinase [Ktedonobacteraceae bacterium]|nr:protein kinase [Ktedonobacteraceae bacterium]
MPDRVGQQFGNYRLTRFLGAGGFAEVYLGKHLYLDRYAAIKVLHEQILAKKGIVQLQQEADILVNLIHPHIVKVLDFSIENTTPFLVMDYIANDTAAKYHQKGTRLHLTTVLQYVNQIASALQYAHNQQVLHLGVSSSAIFVGSNSDVLLGSFGFSMKIEGTHKGLMTSGNIPYIAPEQWNTNPCPASDQYSLAIAAYEWLCGNRPFSANSRQAIKEQHIHTLPPPLREKVPTISTDVDQVVLRALSKDPANRFANIGEFANAFEQACKLPRIFVSHSSKDNEFGMKLVQDLCRVLGSDDAVWYDTYGGLHGGMTWWNTIKQELSTRNTFVVILSPDAVESKWVNDEINIAWHLRNTTGKRIIPVMYRSCNIDLDLSTLQVISFLDRESYEQAFNELLSALGRS